MLNVDFIIIIVISIVISVFETVRTCPDVTCMSRCAIQLPHILQLWQNSERTCPLEEKQIDHPIITQFSSCWHRLYVTDVSLSQSQPSVSNLPPGDGCPNVV